MKFGKGKVGFGGKSKVIKNRKDVTYKRICRRCIGKDIKSSILEVKEPREILYLSKMIDRI